MFLCTSSIRWYASFFVRRNISDFIYNFKLNLKIEVENFAIKSTLWYGPARSSARVRQTLKMSRRWSGLTRWAYPLKSISKLNGYATAMPTAWGLNIVKQIFNFELVVNPCDTAGCSDGCSVNGNSFLCHCNKNPLKKLSVDRKTCGKFNNIFQCQK